MTATPGSSHGVTQTVQQLTSAEMANLVLFDSIRTGYESRSKKAGRARGHAPMTSIVKTLMNEIRGAIENHDEDRKKSYCIKLHGHNLGLWQKLTKHHFCPELEALQVPDPMEHVVAQIAASQRRQQIGVPATASQRRAQHTANLLVESKTSEPAVVDPGHAAQYDKYGDYYYGDMDSLFYDDTVPGYNGALDYYGMRQNTYTHTSNGNIFGYEMFLGVSLALNLILVMGLICLLCVVAVLLYGHISMERKRRNKNGIPIPMDDGSSEV